MVKTKMNQTKQNKYIVQIRSLVILTLLAVVLFTAPHFASLVVSGDKENVSLYKKMAVDEFRDINLVAKSAYVYDIAKGEVLYSKNKNAQLPLASVTKIMTALVATELAESDTISISRNTLLPEGDSGLLIGDMWDMKEIIDLTLISSSNDGARALASVAGLGLNPEGVTFVDYMNKKAIELGMTQSFFLNESGLDENDVFAGSYGSAEDIGKLLSYVYENNYNLMNATTQKEIILYSGAGVYDVENTNKITDNIPGLMASKTGFTDLAGGNLAIIFEAGPIRPIAVVVLGSTIDGRFDDIEKLVDASILSLVSE